MGFYKEGDKRWRVLAIVKDDADQAKDAFKAIKAKPGTLPIANTGDEAAHVPIAPKVAFLFARKGNVIWGVGDEEYAVRADEKAAVTKEDAVAKMKTLLATPTPAAAGSGSAAPPAPPSASAASPPKK
jgi:acyl transferase domain-containing protein